MKLKPGKFTYPIPALSQVVTVAIDDRQEGGHRYLMQHIDIVAIEAMLTESKERGLPRYFALVEGLMLVFPRPDRDYNLVGHYTPPVQTF